MQRLERAYIVTEHAAALAAELAVVLDVPAPALERELKGAYLNGPVAKLSGGWQTRLKLAALLLHEPNL